MICLSHIIRCKPHFFTWCSQTDQLQNVLCLFTYGGDVKFTKGEITASNLECDAIKFEFADANLPIVTAQFTVTSGMYSVPLDNPQNIKGKT